VREDGCGLLIFILEVIENDIENRISGYREVVVEMAVSSCFCMNVKTFQSIEMETFFLNL
jgi:hypothetical protein